MKFNFDISVFDNWTQEIFILSIDNIPDQEDLPQKVKIFGNLYNKNILTRIS